MTIIDPGAARAHAWTTGWSDAGFDLDNGERLYGHDPELLDAYRRGQQARSAVRAVTR